MMPDIYIICMHINLPARLKYHYYYYHYYYDHYYHYYDEYDDYYDYYEYDDYDYYKTNFTKNMTTPWST